MILKISYGKETGMKNNALELYRFIFAYLVVFLHLFTINGRWGGGFIAVEFYFVLSGALMIISIKKHYDSTQSATKICCQFTWHRIKRLIPYTMMLFILSSVKIVLTAGENGIKELLIFSLRNLSDLFFLTSSGMGIRTGTSDVGLWYLSALIIVGHLICYLYVKYDETFVYIIAPLSILMIYGRFALLHGTVGVHLTGAFPELGISEAFLRAFAGISLGVICYYIGEMLKTKQLKSGIRNMLGVLELIGLLGLVFYAYYFGRFEMEFVAIGIICMIIILELGNDSIIKKGLNNKVSGYLGRISLCIYLLHRQISPSLDRIFKYYQIERNVNRMIIGSVIILICSSIIEFIVSNINAGVKALTAKTLTAKTQDHSD